MKKSIIFLFFVFLDFNAVFLIASPEDNTVGVDCPDSVSIGEEFNLGVSLKNFNLDNYDVKFEILNGSRNIAQRLWNGEWKSTSYWMNDCFDTNLENRKDFRLKIVDKYVGKVSVVLKIRDSSNHIQEFNITLLNVNFQDSPSNNIKEEPLNNNNQDIYAELRFDDEDIVNGDDFQIDLEVYNLKEKDYDAKVWIELRNNNSIISEIYDGEKDEWKSGRYYLNGFLKGPGNKGGNIKIRISEKYSDFFGGANLLFKIREGYELKKDIEILKRDIENKENDDRVVDKIIIKSDLSVEEMSNNIAKNDPIRLGGKNSIPIKTEDIKTGKFRVYESKNEIIKKYSVYGFAFLCVILCVFIIFRKLD